MYIFTITNIFTKIDSKNIKQPSIKTNNNINTKIRTKYPITIHTVKRYKTFRYKISNKCTNIHNLIKFLSLLDNSSLQSFLEIDNFIQLWCPKIRENP